MRADPHHHCYSVLFQFKLDLVPILSLLGEKTALLGVCCQPKFRKILFVPIKLESLSEMSNLYRLQNRDLVQMQLHMNV